MFLYNFALQRQRLVGNSSLWFPWGRYFPFSWCTWPSPCKLSACNSFYLKSQFLYWNFARQFRYRIPMWRECSCSRLRSGSLWGCDSCPRCPWWRAWPALSGMFCSCQTFHYWSPPVITDMAQFAYNKSPTWMCICIIEQFEESDSWLLQSPGDASD